MFGSFLKNVKGIASVAAPLAAAGAAFSTGGQAATLQRVAGGLGALGGTQQGQATAVDRAQAPAQESATSGEVTNVYNMGGTRGMVRENGLSNVSMIAPPLLPPRSYQQQANLPAIIGGGLTAGRSLFNMLGIAGGAAAVAPMIIDPFTGEPKKLRVTRRLKSQVKKAVELFGIEFVAEQMGVDVEVVVYVMTKTMRNDGPYVTKAAVRKTRQTVRKMKAMCDMYDDLRPAAKRRAPTRATSRTRVVNVK